MTTEFVYVKDESFPLAAPTDLELFSSDAGKKMRMETAFKEMGRAVVAIPRSGDRVRGAEHEYNKKTYGEIYKKNEIVFRGINTTADHVLQSGYRIIGNDEKSQDSVREWAEYIQLHKILHDVVRHLMIWGDCFIEIVEDKDPKGWGIVELKLLHPHTMKVYASESGDIVGYIQHPDGRRMSNDPTNIKPRSQTTGRRQLSWKQEVKRADKNAIVFDPWEIIHLKWNSMPNSYYGTSTIEPMKGTLTTYVGTMQDMSALIRRYSSPMVVWKIGTPEMPASGTMMRDFERAMRKRNIGDDPVVPGIVDHEVIGAGQKAMDLAPYIQALRNDLFAGIAVPEVVLGGNSQSSGGDEIKLEAFTRKVGEIQSQLSDECRKYMFSRQLKITDGKNPITRKDWGKIPLLVFNPPETTEQKYLRVSTIINSNIGTIEEGREMLQMYPTEIPEGERAMDQQMEITKHAADVAPNVGTPGVTGPSASSSRTKDKTSAQKPKTGPPKEHK